MGEEGTHLTSRGLGELGGRLELEIRLKMFVTYFTKDLEIYIIIYLLILR